MVQSVLDLDIDPGLAPGARLVAGLQEIAAYHYAVDRREYDAQRRLAGILDLLEDDNGNLLYESVEEVPSELIEALAIPSLAAILIKQKAEEESQKAARLQMICHKIHMPLMGEQVEVSALDPTTNPIKVEVFSRRHGDYTQGDSESDINGAFMGFLASDYYSFRVWKKQRFSLAKRYSVQVLDPAYYQKPLVKVKFLI